MENGSELSRFWLNLSTVRAESCPIEYEMCEIWLSGVKLRWMRISLRPSGGGTVCGGLNGGKCVPETCVISLCARFSRVTLTSSAWYQNIYVSVPEYLIVLQHSRRTVHGQQIVSLSTRYTSQIRKGSTAVPQYHSTTIQYHSTTVPQYHSTT
eukprot:2940221-Rhodomonas_salina.1